MDQNRLESFPTSMSKLEDNFEFLSSIYDAYDDYDVKKLFIRATEEEIATIVELIVNMLDFNVKLPEGLRKQMADHAAFYRSIRRTRTINGAKQKLIKGDPEAVKLLLEIVVPEIEKILYGETTTTRHE